MNRDRMRALADRIRNVATPMRTVTVVVLERTWPGKLRQPNTTPHDVETALPIRYKVRELNSREISGSGGRYEDGAVKVGPITPPYSTMGGGGFTESQLNPTGSSHIEVLYILSGDKSGEYKLADLETTKALSWFLILNRSRSTP
jgi:hypothetical protein